MNTVTRRLRVATSPLMLAVAMGLLGPSALLDDDLDSAADIGDPGFGDEGVAARDETTTREELAASLEGGWIALVDAHGNIEEG